MASVIAVVGATGQQGGGLVAALSGKQGGFKLRCLTRDPGSEKAQALARSSPDITLVKADFGDRRSLVEAFTGVTGVFLVTDCFGAAFSYEAEVQQGKAAVDAAVEARVPFVVFSALEDTRAALRGKVPEVAPGHFVPHFEAKAAVTEYLKASGLPHATLLTCPYYENALRLWRFRRREDGALAFSDNAGPGKIAMHAVGDIGASAAVLLADPQRSVGQTVPVVGEVLSLEDVAGTLSSLAGTPVHYEPISDEEAAKLPFPGAPDLANMYAYYRLCPEFLQLRPLGRRVVTGPTFAEWAQAHAEPLRARLAAAS